MTYLDGWTIAVIDAVLLCALAYGVFNFFFRPSPMYFKFMTCAVLCYTLSELLWTAYCFCYGEIPEGIMLFSLGYFACYLFMLSANYGPMDRLADDGSRSARRARRLAFIAPAALLFVSVGFVFLNPGASVIYHLLTLFVQIPKIFASYFNLKHILIKDENYGLVGAVRVCNILALCIYALDLIGWAFDLYGLTFGFYATSILTPICLLVMLIAGKRGYKRWLN